MTIEKLEQIYITAIDYDILEFNTVWNMYAELFGIVTKEHEDMLLATILAEVGTDLKSIRENLNYTPEALRTTFTRYEDNPEWSERDGRTEEHSADQVSIGNVAYADRLGNGDIGSGDGYKFRGGSFIQTTGRYNWEESAKTISMLTGATVGAENLEESCETTVVGLFMTFAFSYENDIASCETMDCCTDKVNMYTDSRDERNEYYDMISNL